MTFEVPCKDQKTSTRMRTKSHLGESGEVTQELAPVAPLTESDEGGDDRHGQGGHEQVDGARQEGGLPHAGVPQSNDVGVGVVHLNVAVDADPRREGAADLRGRKARSDGFCHRR